VRHRASFLHRSTAESAFEVSISRDSHASPICSVFDVPSVTR
jgi:hypothetical protein